jgi:hypothetical protein
VSRFTYLGTIDGQTGDPGVEWHRFALPLQAAALLWSPAYAWCEENFGTYGEQGWPLTIWSASVNTFFVRKDDDAFAFRMRWC